MGITLLELLKPIQRIILSSKDFMKKYHLVDKTMNESDLQRVHKYTIFPGDSKIG